MGFYRGGDWGGAWCTGLSFQFSLKCKEIWYERTAFKNNSASLAVSHKTCTPATADCIVEIFAKHAVLHCTCMYCVPRICTYMYKYAWYMHTYYHIQCMYMYMCLKVYICPYTIIRQNILYGQINYRRSGQQEAIHVSIGHVRETRTHQGDVFFFIRLRDHRLLELLGEER